MSTFGMAMSSTGQYQMMTAKPFIGISIDYGYTWSFVSKSIYNLWGCSISSNGQYITATGPNAFMYTLDLTGSFPYLISENATISGDVGIGKNTVINGNLNVSRDTVMAGNLTVSRNTVINGNLTVSGNTDLSGNLTVSRNTTINGNLTVSGAITGQSITVTSDYRIKKNPTLLDESFVVDNLRPVHYTNILSNKEDLGFIAHEVQEVFPYLVDGEKDETQNQSLNYIGLISILVKEMQEVKKTLKELTLFLNNNS
jgi:carbonic anhydrase/acetyltransferase-like protein (isoleucine patch superfamily)